MGDFPAPTAPKSRFFKISKYFVAAACFAHGNVHWATFRGWIRKKFDFAIFDFLIFFYFLLGGGVWWCGVVGREFLAKIVKICEFFLKIMRWSQNVIFF